MFPLRDHNPSDTTPYVTWALMVANIAIFLSYGLSSDPDAAWLIYEVYALTPAEVTNGIDLHGFVTSMFLHGGWMHLIGNMLFLWIFGDNLEDAMGHVGFALFYLGTGLLAGAAHVIADPSSMVPTVGASGAIAGVMGGYLLLYPKARVDILFILIVFIRIVPIPAFVMLLIWFALQIGGGVASDLTGGGVAYWAHAGGFVAGVIAALPYFILQGGPNFWSRNDMHPPHPEAEGFRMSSIPKVPRRR